MSNQDRKLAISFFAFLFLFLVVASKAFYVQVIKREKLLAYASSQFERTTKIFPKRGLILDREGRALAINIRRYNIFTIPKDRKPRIRHYRELVRAIPALQLNKFWPSVRKRKKFTWVARNISLTKEQVEKVKEVPDVFVEEENSRFYPNHELAANILGFVGVDNTGLSGLEYSLNKELQGEAVILKYFKDAKGRTIKFKAVEKGKKSKDIHLSIDKTIQAKAEKYLAEAIKFHDGDSGGVGVMDASTGEILAMANYPTFDPNSPGKFRGIKKRSSFVTDPFEPGSTFKTFTIASALEHHVARIDSNYYCERGRFKVGNHTIKEAESKKENEWLSVADILKYSSNIGTTKIAFDLKFPKLRKTLDKLGIGEKTGIEIPGESRGIFTSESNVGPLSLSNISFGQGVATTGIQMLQAYAIFANGGYRVQPTILKVDDPMSIKRKKVFDVEVVEQINQMLKSVVEDGTGTRAKVRYIDVAGKTSTAQRVSENGGYSGYVSGFIGYTLNTRKRYVIYAYVDNPKENGYYGNKVAGPIFRKLTGYLIFKDKDIKRFKDQLTEKSNRHVDKIEIRRAGIKKIDPSVMPNFYGLDKKSVKKIVKQLDVDVQERGFGIVVEQYPHSGAKLEQGSVIKVKFEPPRYE
jgi:cell division protein FtsI (penicillin-binding protein 3)